LPEVAFLGRSNVGKSSLINSLVSAKVAKTSNTPGRTQAINFFEIRWPGRPRPELVFADLPGYGYARVPKEITRGWPEFIEPYLAERPTLTLCLCLVDANIPPQPSDTQMIDYLRQTERPLLVVATKADRVGTRIQASLNALKKAHGVDYVLAYSAKSGLGQDELWKRLRAAGSTAKGELA
jgi:GTP-binding protein